MRGLAEKWCHGYTCSIGDKKHNLALSEKRAFVVRGYLSTALQRADLKVRLAAPVGKGEADPVKRCEQETVLGTGDGVRNKLH